MKNDEFGDRMKAYENADKLQYCGKFPVYMRLDGRSFSKFTKSLVASGKLVKPRDTKFESIFIAATKATVQEFHFALGFHQSDEISLFFKVMENPESELPFGGTVQKLTSVVASYFTAAFIFEFNNVYGYIPSGVSFDARVCELPTVSEATNMLVWRWKDGHRNMIQDIAHHKFGPKLLDGKSTNSKWEMIGSPKICAGNFIKRVDISENNDIVRHRIERIDVDFKSMTFDERMNLIYGKVDYV